MAFWATTWEKTASTAAAEEQLARLQDGVVRLETKIGNEDTEDTLSHDLAPLKKNKLDLSGGKKTGDIDMGYNKIIQYLCHLHRTQMVG